MSTTNTNDADKRPSFIGALIGIGFLCFMMFAQIFLLGEDWVTHISLIFAIVVCAIIALVSGFSWQDIQKGILYGCEIAMLPMLKKQLAEYAGMERTFRTAIARNRALEEDAAQVQVLREQLTEAQAKAARASDAVDRVTGLELENADLRAVRDRWTDVALRAGDVGRVETPEQLQAVLDELTKDQATARERSGAVGTELKVARAMLERAEQDVERLKGENVRLTANGERQAEQIASLESNMLFIKEDRKALKRVLQSYDEEDKKMSFLYQGAHQDQLAQQQSTVEQLEAKLADTQAKLAEATQRVSDKTVREREAKLEQLTAENDRLRKALDALEETEAELRARISNGDFNPKTTKIVHLQQNPTVAAGVARAARMKALEAENGELSQQLMVLKEQLRQQQQQLANVSSGSSSSSSSSSSFPAIATPSPFHPSAFAAGGAAAAAASVAGAGMAMASTPATASEASGLAREVSSLRSQLESAEKRNKRLKEVFHAKITEFREACYSLTGYKVDMLNDQYRLHSMYAERPDDVLMFQTATDGSVSLLETEFSQTCDAFLSSYLVKFKSIPAFLAAVTLDLVGKQTMIG